MVEHLVTYCRAKQCTLQGGSRRMKNRMNKKNLNIWEYFVQCTSTTQSDPLNFFYSACCERKAALVLDSIIAVYSFTNKLLTANIHSLAFFRRAFLWEFSPIYLNALCEFPISFINMEKIHHHFNLDSII